MLGTIGAQIWVKGELNLVQKLIWNTFEINEKI